MDKVLRDKTENETHDLMVYLLPLAALVRLILQPGANC